MARRQTTKTDYSRMLFLLLVLLLGSLYSLKLVYDVQLPSGRRPYTFIIWNMFLAWLPLIFALGVVAANRIRNGVARYLTGLICGACWLFFYPNAPYLITDLLHIHVRYDTQGVRLFWHDIVFWNHLLAIFSASFLGLVIGSISLWWVHRVLHERFGALLGWLLTVIFIGLGSFGVYVGRFERWNSWEVATRPEQLLKETVGMLTDLDKLAHIIPFCKAMFFLMLVSYLIVYGIGRWKK